jgi:hypothetical protein
MSLPVLLLAGAHRVLAELRPSQQGRGTAAERSRLAHGFPGARSNLKPAPGSPRLDTTTTGVILHM